MTSPNETVERLLRATNDHDLDQLVACFGPEYVNETPVHPARSFRGREQVRRNWEQIFAAVTDLQAELLDCLTEGNSVWTEWEMRGTRPDGSRHLMAGVIIFVVEQDLIQQARFYLEPVDDGTATADDAVRAQVAGR